MKTERDSPLVTIPGDFRIDAPPEGTSPAERWLAAVRFADRISTELIAHVKHASGKISVAPQRFASS
ncbi:MAG: hypothetical protein H0T60_17485 [Acidobacteria bacterium]|nr:hypothetical protein [Acidobacteriota bacterium]